MRLRSALRAYCANRALSANYVRQLHDTTTVFCRWLGRDPQLESLTAATINRFAQHLLAEGIVRPRTVKARIGNLRTLLAATRPQQAREILRVRVPQPAVRAFTIAEVERLLKAAGGLSGRYNSGVGRAAWWRVLIRLNWDAGLRVGDLLALRWSDLRPDLKLVLTEQKTGRVCVRSISPGTWAELTAIRQPARELVLPWPFRREAFYRQFRQLAASAGVSGTSKFLRRGGATQIWKSHGPAAAAKYLNHADGTGELAWKNYVDRSQLVDDLPLPPTIE